MKAIEVLRISVPAAWGEVEDVSSAETVTVSGPGPQGASDDGRRWIEWKKPPVERTSRGGCRLSILFEGQADAAADLTGRLEARFSGAVSGAEGVDMYSAGACAVVAV